MKYFAGICIAVLLFLSIPLVDAEAAPTMAFGYLANNSGDDNFDYLETIFPNSFANSLKNIFDINVVKPIGVNKILKKYKMKLKKKYEPFELPELAEKTDADLFIYGNFTPLPDGRIKILLHLYSEQSKRLFTFTNIGRMETEIFRLVDRITDILLNFMDSKRFYMTQAIAPASRIGFFTNLTAEDLNEFYIPFLNNRYRISFFQANTLGDDIDEKNIEIFKSISTRDNSYDTITDKRKVKFLTGTWTGDRYIKDVEAARKLFQKHDLYYQKTKNAVLDRLYKTYNGKMDYLIIVGFNSRHTKAWIRCIDLKNKDLIWMESDITGNITEIALKMIDRMKKGIDKKSGK